MKDCGTKWQAYKKEKNVKGQAEYRKFQSSCLILLSHKVAGGSPENLVRGEIHARPWGLR
jgi:hypothetical protein